MINNSKKTLIITIIVLLVIALGIFIITKLVKNNNTLKIDELTQNDINYYVLKDDKNYGVIDKEGNIVIEPKYAKVEIPNPTTDLFLCTNQINETGAKWEVLNKDNQSILTEFQNVEAISINQLTSYVPYEKNTLIYKEGALYGIINFEGKKITEAIYEEISGLDYKEGYLKVKKDGNYGIININGKEIIKNEYDNITADGYYDEQTKYAKAGFITRIKTDDGLRFGYVDYKGKKILDPIYNEVNRITEIEEDKNIYLITATNAKCGLMKNSKVILESEYSDIEYDTNSKLLVVDKGQAQGVMNLSGKTIIPVDYESVTIGGDYINAIKENTKLVFDTEGNKLDTDISNHTRVSDEYSIIIDDDNNYNIVDNSNNKLLSIQYIYLEYFRGDMFIATQESNTGIITAKGNIVVPALYGIVQKIENSDLLQATDTQTNRIDLIDTEGQVIEGLENASIEITDSYIKIYSDKEAKYFTLEGKPISNRDLFKDNKIFADSKNGKWGFIDINGNNITNYEYDMVTEQNGSVAGFKLNNLWGVVDTDAKVILEPSYQIDTNNPKFIGQYYQDDTGINVPEYSKDMPKENR